MIIPILILDCTYYYIEVVLQALDFKFAKQQGMASHVDFIILIKQESFRACHIMLLPRCSHELLKPVTRSEYLAILCSMSETTIM